MKKWKKRGKKRRYGRKRKFKVRVSRGGIRL